MKSCVFVRNIHPLDVFNLKLVLLAKIIVHKSIILQWKCTHMFVLNCFRLFWIVNSIWYVLIQTRWLFQCRESYFMDYGLTWEQRFEVKHLNDGFVFHANTLFWASQDVNWWTGVVWIIGMFLSAVQTLILTAPIHCRGSIGEQVMQCYISPNLTKKQTHLHVQQIVNLEFLMGYRMFYMVWKPLSVQMTFFFYMHVLILNNIHFAF